MRGILFAVLGGAFITLQGVANSRISESIGAWQAATVTQFTGFLTALLILVFIRDRGWRKFKQVKPVYLAGGSFASFIIFGNIVAFERIGVTLTISAIVIAQLIVTFFIDSNGWFGVAKKKMRLPQMIGIGMMIAGIVVLRI
ncbi:DMT family transporter [Paenibacillus alkalitolerans]|uniref:DMT family transporter n=1 Tax=Paenibacillus alkalitolerans TaxID=2799335 RepID=UPI0018F3C254|nr:DMT family transporter [Paenibacillus alkalitolerans]